jgi:hypothetical protein
LLCSLHTHSTVLLMVFAHALVAPHCAGVHHECITTPNVLSVFGACCAVLVSAVLTDAVYIMIVLLTYSGQT